LFLLVIAFRSNKIQQVGSSEDYHQVSSRSIIYFSQRAAEPPGSIVFQAAKRFKQIERLKHQTKADLNQFLVG
jgi:hypothetical protein